MSSNTPTPDPGDVSTAQPTDILAQAQAQQSAGDFVRGYTNRLRAGDIGILPILIGIVVIAIIFQILNSNYITPRNIVNLIVQMAGVTAIAYGIVFVLLLGEVDLSVGEVSGVGGVTMAILLVANGSG